MAIKYGDLLKELRLRNNLTQQDLANITNYTKQHISRIENNEVVATRIASKQFTMLLDFDFVRLSKHIYDFDSYRDYEAYFKLTLAIEKGSFSELQSILEYYKIDESVKSLDLLYLSYYAKALSLLDSSPEHCIEHCFKVLKLNIDDVANITIDKTADEFELALILALGHAYYALNKNQEAYTLSELLYNHCKTFFYNAENKYIDLNFNTMKICIHAAFNFGHMNFVFKNYAKSLELTNEGIEKSKDFNILYTLHFLYKQKTLNHYFLEEFEEAKKYYRFVEMFCEVNDKAEYFTKFENLVTNNYPKILEK